MLETLVSSRIRRALFEYILAHPDGRFYLRGLAKELGLAVSPLRRELKRLEQAGMLRSLPEGNLLFYTVQTACPAYLLLRQAGQRAPEVSAPAAQSPAATPAAAVTVPVRPAAAAQPVARLWTRPLSAPLLVTAAALGIALILSIASISYLSITNRHLLAEVTDLKEEDEPEVTVLVQERPASGLMRGQRWQLLPGAFGGGFSADTKEAL